MKETEEQRDTGGQRDRGRWGTHRGKSGVHGVRACRCRAAIPEPVPQGGHLAVQGLSGLCDVIQLPLQSSAICLSPGRLFLRLLHLPLQLLHSKVPLLHLWGSEEAGSHLGVPHSHHSICPTALSFSLAILETFLLQTLRALFHTPGPSSPVRLLPGCSFRSQFKCHLLREECLPCSSFPFLFIALVMICNCLCWFVGFLCLSSLS